MHSRLAPDFDVSVTCTDGRTVVSVQGEVDVATAPVLRKVLAEAHARSHRRVGDDPLVIDLSGVTFLDASGLTVLVGAATGVRRAGGDVVLRDPSRITLRVLKITELLGTFHVEQHDGQGSVPPTGATSARPAGP